MSSNASMMTVSIIHKPHMWDWLEQRCRGGLQITWHQEARSRITKGHIRNKCSQDKTWSKTPKSCGVKVTSGDFKSMSPYIFQISAQISITKLQDLVERGNCFTIKERFIVLLTNKINLSDHRMTARHFVIAMTQLLMRGKYLNQSGPSHHHKIFRKW